MGSVAPRGSASVVFTVQLPTLGSKREGAAYDSPDVRLMAGAWASHLRHVRALQGQRT